jgi:hypothetical protein
MPHSKEIFSVGDAAKAAAYIEYFYSLNQI